MNPPPPAAIAPGASPVLAAGLNADIFPALGAARDKVTWANGYFQIDGKPVFLTAGEIHYARIPRELWRDRLWRIKKMGFNTIQFYTFWNSNEPQDGVWDFSGNSDLDAFLALVHEMGLYAIARVGPYCCAEWEHGGFPSWLTIKPGMVLRENNEQYLRYVDRYLAKIEAIVARHQIHKGGSVIMMQLENENLAAGWGADTSSPYMMHLYEKARAAGIEIPIFFSGLHHGADPSGESPYPVSQTPWYTTEFWTGWIGRYGDMPKEMLEQKVRGTWKIIAFGGGGYGYYMVHGGSNFGYSGDTVMASYDYSAPIGEWGGFHNLFFPARRAAQFAQSFSALLTGSVNAPGFASATAGRITTRQSPHGKIVFADNFLIPVDENLAAQQIAPTADAFQLEQNEPATSSKSTRIEVLGRGRFPRHGELVLHPNEIRTLILDLPWTEATEFEAIVTNILLRQKIAGTEIWVCYGAPGDYGEVNLKRRASCSLPTQYGFTYPEGDGVQEIEIDSGDGGQALFLIMNTALADRTWALKDKLVVGATFVREDGTAELPLEGGRLRVYPGARPMEVAPVQLAGLPSLGGWQWRDAARERWPAFNDDAWLGSPEAQPMESYDSFQNRYGWYRTTLHGEGIMALRPAGLAANVQAFLNGHPADPGRLHLKPGENTLALFTRIAPRPKLYAFNGLIDHGAARGIWGPFLAGDQPAGQVTKWRLAKASPTDLEGEGKRFAQADFDDGHWALLAGENSQQPVGKMHFWLRGNFQNPAGLTEALAFLPDHLPGIGPISERLRLFVNGSEVKIFKQPFSHGVVLANELKPGVNTLLLAVQVGGTIREPITSNRTQMELWPCKIPTGWKFRGGLDGMEETAIIGTVKNWDGFLAQPWRTEGTPGKGMPVFWRTSFVYRAIHRELIGLQTGGLSSGHVWLNGHNLGDSKQQFPLYLPECWLKSGANELVILDVEGATPEKVRLVRLESLQRIEIGR